MITPRRAVTVSADFNFITVLMDVEILARHFRGNFSSTV